MFYEKINIIIPVYNRVDLIGYSIESALAQDYGNFDIIIVDNASDDGTWDVLNDYHVRYPDKIKIYRNKKNIGPVGNWEKCLSFSDGVYVKFLFSDDILLPNCLSLLAENFTDDVAFAVSTVLVGTAIDDIKTKSYYQWRKHTGYYSTMSFLSEAWCSNDISHSPGAALFRLNDLNRSLVKSVVDPIAQDFMSTGAGSDLLFFLLTAVEFENVYFVTEPTSFFRVHSGAFTIGDRALLVQKCYTASKLFFYSRYLDRLGVDVSSILMFDWIRYQVKTRRSISFSRYTEEVIGISNVQFEIARVIGVFVRLFFNFPRYILRKI